MSKRRQEYLDQYWIKYPPTPRGALRFGRVYQWRHGLYQVSDWTVKDYPEFKGRDVLIDGDLIAIMPQSQFVLLAPNLTEHSGFFKEQDDPWVKKRKWNLFLKNLRNFFEEKKFLEVSSPTLVACPGTEPSLDPFVTEFKMGSKTKRYYLPTSPELNLKKMLSEGADKIFELAKVFRNGESTDRHHFEFTMCEWYRAYANLDHIKHDVIELIENSADYLKVDRPKEVLTFTVKSLFKTYCDFDLTPDTTLEELKLLAHKLKVDVTSAQVLDDYFYLIFMDKIEYQWPKDRLVFVEKYPPYQAALARLDSDGWADRFEAYWNGLELANAFFELNDPKLQRERAQEDLDKKTKMNKDVVDLDEDFFKALEFGLPPSAGIAVGVERLYMALLQKNNINEIK